MAAAVLTLALAFLCGGGAWLLLGPRLTLSEDSASNDVLNLLVYVGVALPPAFAAVLFALEAV